MVQLFSRVLSYKPHITVRNRVEHVFSSTALLPSLFIDTNWRVMQSIAIRNLPYRSIIKKSCH